MLVGTGGAIGESDVVTVVELVGASHCSIVVSERSTRRGVIGDCRDKGPVHWGTHCLRGGRSREDDEMVVQFNGDGMIADGSSEERGVVLYQSCVGGWSSRGTYKHGIIGVTGTVLE